jgi:hypothetical protein
MTNGFPDFDPDELIELEPILEAMRHTRGRRLSVEYLLVGWQQFVGHIERGYSSSIYDYTNDLSKRRLLQRVLDANISNRLKLKLTNLVRQIDDQFIGLTRTIAEPIPGTKPEAKEWWCYRVPLNAGSELQKDLAEFGLA